MILSISRNSIQLPVELVEVFLDLFVVIGVVLVVAFVEHGQNRLAIALVGSMLLNVGFQSFYNGGEIPSAELAGFQIGCRQNVLLEQEDVILFFIPELSTEVLYPGTAPSGVVCPGRCVQDR